MITVICALIQKNVVTASKDKVQAEISHFISSLEIKGTSSLCLCVGAIDPCKNVTCFQFFHILSPDPLAVCNQKQFLNDAGQRTREA